MLIDRKKDEDKEPSTNASEGRDLELENIIGNLMIAEFQIDRLRTRLSEKIAGYGRGVSGYHYKSDKKPVSISTFEHKGKLYRVSLKVDEVKANNKSDEDLR